MLNRLHIVPASGWYSTLPRLTSMHKFSFFTLHQLRSTCSLGFPVANNHNNVRDAALSQCRSVSSTKLGLNTCPFHQMQSIEVVQSEVTMNSAVPHCPLIGDTPVVPCPVEVSVADNVTLTYKLPTLKSIIQQLGKSQLSAYVASTAFAGYIIGGGCSVPIAVSVLLGTLLQSYSANTANQIIEAPYDKLMKRTRRRPLPMKFISKRMASFISASEMLLGTSILYYVSPLAALLGCLNWVLYVCMYTPLKRISALNTWFGSIVGGIPPVMGGLAVTNSLSAVAGPVWLLGALLFVWQIPHFNGLAFHCRRDYEAAGYKMLAFYNPWRASFYAVLLSIVMAAITLLGPYYTNSDVEEIWYYPVAFMANAVMIYKALLFHRAPQLHCRGCFVYSYLYLSVMLAAIMLNHIQPLHLMYNSIEYVSKLLEGVQHTPKMTSQKISYNK